MPPSTPEHVLFGLNQEHVAFWLVLEALSDGPKNWSELEKLTSISTATLSRKLKKMQKMGIVRRKIVPAFPPRTVYRIDKNFPNYALIKWLKIEIERLKLADELTRASIELSKYETAEQALDNLMKNLKDEIRTSLMHLLEIPLHEHSEHWVPLLTTLITMRIMQPFWILYEALSFPDEKRQKAIRILDSLIKEEEPIARKIIERARRR